MREKRQAILSKKIFKRLLLTWILSCGISFAFGNIVAEAAPDNVNYISEDAELIKEIRKSMVNRETKVTLQYMDEKLLEKGILDKWLEEVFAETGKTDEGDYLKTHYKSAKMKYSGKMSKNIYYYTITIDFTYHSTHTQEKEVTKKIDKIVKELRLDDKNVSDYRKINLVHEYMIEHISYDKKADPSSYSTYSACVKGKTVCQGYATMFYRLMQESGIDCRVITGKSKNGAHAWNIVKLDGKYYNIDVTWADTEETKKYFLKGSKDFADHKSDSKYLTSTFTKKYPIQKTNYSKTEHLWDTTYKVEKRATFTQNGSKTQKCEICGKLNSSNKLAIPKVSTVKLASDAYIYNGKTKSPEVKVEDSKGNPLVKNRDYTISYGKGRKNVGRYSVIVKLKGDYSGSKTLYFTVRPKAPSSMSVKVDKKKKSAKLTWKKSTGASGYAVYYRENPEKNSGYKRLTRTTKLNYTKTKLKANTTYEFRIFPYYKTKVSGKTVYFESEQFSEIILCSK